MRDKAGRDIHYLRLSVTDRCNLRCAYCMPQEGVAQLTHSDILSFEETERLVRLLAGLGVRRVKITGGEPLVRLGVCDMIRRVKALPGIEQVTLTTNGVLLGRYLAELMDAGVDGVNVSLDTLDRGNYERLTGSDDLKSVLSSVHAAAKVLPVKLNVVPVKGVNGDELCDLAAMAKSGVTAVRFIELMPVGRAKGFERIASDEVKAALESCFGAATPAGGDIGNGPAEYVRLPGFAGLIGFIHAISEAFCASCNRVRLTADGCFMPCLGCPDQMDVKGPLRGAATDRELSALLKRAISAKPARHGFTEEEHAPGREMNAIGG
jgi:cyclic pyranopterin phosphate synthase